MGRHQFYCPHYCTWKRYNRLHLCRQLVSNGRIVPGKWYKKVVWPFKTAGPLSVAFTVWTQGITWCVYVMAGQGFSNTMSSETWLKAEVQLELSLKWNFTFLHSMKKWRVMIYLVTSYLLLLYSPAVSHALVKAWLHAFTHGLQLCSFFTIAFDYTVAKLYLL